MQNLHLSETGKSNLVVVGAHGSGHMEMVGRVLAAHRARGARLIVIDPYGIASAQDLGGHVRTIVVGTADTAVNPLDRIHPSLTAQVNRGMAMLELLGVSAPAETQAAAMLKTALGELYQAWGRGGSEIFLNLPLTLATLQVYLLGQAAQNLNGQRDLHREVANRLTPLISGQYAPLFGPTTLPPPSRPVTVYDVSRLPRYTRGGQLHAALLAALVSHIVQGCRRERRQITPTLFSDIAPLLHHPTLARDFQAVYEAAPAHNLVVAAQSIPALLGTKNGDAYPGQALLTHAQAVALFSQAEAVPTSLLTTVFPAMPPACAGQVSKLARGQYVARLRNVWQGAAEGEAVTV